VLNLAQPFFNVTAHCPDLNKINKQTLFQGANLMKNVKFQHRIEDYVRGVIIALSIVLLLVYLWIKVSAINK